MLSGDFMPSINYIFGRPADLKFILFLGGVLGGLFLLSFCIFIYVYHRYCTEQQNEQFLIQYQKLQMQYYQQLLSAGNDMRILRHDLNNHLQTFQHLLANNTAYAASYLSQIEALVLPNAEEPDISCFRFMLEELHKQAEQAGCRLEVFLTSDENDPDDILPVLLSAIFFAALQQARPGCTIVLKRSAQGEFFLTCPASRQTVSSRIELRSLSAFTNEYGFRLETLHRKGLLQFSLIPAQVSACSEYSV